MSNGDKDEAMPVDEPLPRYRGNLRLKTADRIQTEVLLKDLDETEPGPFREYLRRRLEEVGANTLSGELERNLHVFDDPSRFDADAPPHRERRKEDGHETHYERLGGPGGLLLKAEGGEYEDLVAAAAPAGNRRLGNLRLAAGALLLASLVPMVTNVVGAFAADAAAKNPNLPPQAQAVKKAEAVSYRNHALSQLILVGVLGVFKLKLTEHEQDRLERSDEMKNGLVTFVEQGNRLFTAAQLREFEENIPEMTTPARG